MAKKYKESAERVKRLLAFLGDTQAKLAKRLNITQPMVSAWVGASDAPSPAFSIRLANLASFPDNLWFLERGGLSPDIIPRMAKAMGENAIIRPKEGEMILVPRVRKTPQGLESAGEPLKMPPEAIPNPLSTYCFVLQGYLAGYEAVVDVVDADGENLLPFWGQQVLMEFAPKTERDDYPLCPEGMVIGALYDEESRTLGKDQWIAKFLMLPGYPFGKNPTMFLTQPIVVGLWTALTYEVRKPSPTISSGPVTTAEEFGRWFESDAKRRFPRLEGETDEDWLTRASRAAEEENTRRLREEVSKPEAIARWVRMQSVVVENIQRAGGETRLAPGCKILGRVIIWFPVRAEKAK